MSSAWDAVEVPSPTDARARELLRARLHKRKRRASSAIVNERESALDALVRSVAEEDRPAVARAMMVAIELHNEVVEKMRVDRERAARLFGALLDHADPLYTYLTVDPEPEVIGTAEEVAEAGRRAAVRAEREKHEETELAAEAARIAATCGTSLCGAFIAAGKQGFVYEHATDATRVVKVYRTKESAERDARAFGVLGRLSAHDPSFRSIAVERGPDPGQGHGQGSVFSLVMDRFEGPLGAYVGTGKYAGAAAASRVTTSHFQDLLGQFDILHRNGAAHGDAHAGNSGLVARGDSCFFVVGDPTMLAISPLSWLSDVAAGPILEILRAQGGSLYRDMTDVETDEALRALLRSHNVEPTDANVLVARGFVDQHRLVAGEAESDMAKLMHTMRDVPGILDPRSR